MLSHRNPSRDRDWGKHSEKLYAQLQNQTPENKRAINMDNATYCYSTDYTPLTTTKSTRKAAHSTAINMGTSEKLPKDYLIWSLCNTLYVNFCCLGFLALIYSVKVSHVISVTGNGEYKMIMNASWNSVTNIITTDIFGGWQGGRGLKRWHW